MERTHCPLCGSNHCKITDGEDFGILISCSGYQTKVYISETIAEDFNNDDLIFQRMINLIVERILHSGVSKSGAFWHFYYNPTEVSPPSDAAYINLSNLLKTYPNSMLERANRALMNIARKHPAYGVSFYMGITSKLCFPEGRNLFQSSEGLLNILIELGYIRRESERYSYSITASGWQKAEELDRKNNEVRQGFVAMSFKPETAEIREGFRKAINAAGYAVSIIDEKEHNNQIVPEIFYEIQHSRFVVVDITVPNFGAYYEAGYAQGLGKEVIVCCKRDVFENKDGKYIRPHFDISQKSMIIWDSINELVERLKRRIEATVG